MIADWAGHEGCLKEYSGYLAQLVDTTRAARSKGKDRKQVYDFNTYAHMTRGQCEGALADTMDAAREQELREEMLDAVIATVLLHEIGHHVLDHVSAGTTTSSRSACARWRPIDGRSQRPSTPTASCAPPLPLFLFIASTGGGTLEEEIRSSHPSGLHRIRICWSRPACCSTRKTRWALMCWTPPSKTWTEPCADSQAVQDSYRGTAARIREHAVVSILVLMKRAASIEQFPTGFGSRGYRRRLERQFAECGIDIDGPNAWDIQVNNDDFYARVFADGALGFGESYMDGWWDVRDLVGCIYRLLAGRLDERSRSWRDALTWLSAALINRQRGSRAFEVAQRHYDLGNELYEAMLDRRMIYSCGFWESAHTSTRRRRRSSR